MRYAALPLVLALTGCATAPQTTIPESLVQECKAPVLDVRTVAGLVQGILDYESALAACNDDKAAIRAHLSNTKEKS